MYTNFMDSEVILLHNEQWTQLEEKWGTPVDLDASEELPKTPLQLSIWNSKSSLDSSSIFKNIPSKVVKRSPKTGTLDYKGFIQDLKEKIAYQQCYFVCGQMLSAASVEIICNQIDDIFKSVERLCTATSTVRRKPVPDMVSRSNSVDGLSIEDMAMEKEPYNEDYDNIDEALDKLSLLSNTCMSIEDKETRESVTALVKKFSVMLAEPMASCSPRKRQRYTTKFQELLEFWEKLADTEDEPV